MARKSFVLMVMGTVIFFLCSISSADVPLMINYSGKVTKPPRRLVDGTFQMTFSIYPNTSKGTPADWTETQAHVMVKDGIFSVLLGSINPIPASVFDGSVKYLGVQIESDPVLIPLKPIVSVAYAYHAGSADCGWADDGTVVRLQTDTDNVGIGTPHPDVTLHVKGSIMSEGTAGSGRLILRSSAPGGHQYEWYADGAGVGTMELWDRTASASRLVVDPQGNIGIGIQTPAQRLDIAGTTRTEVLEITGGSDLAEPFEISDPGVVPKGALVVIDDENPGRLKMSDVPYDRRVAGVVSGAGGINPGLTLSQKGLNDHGQNVALSGQVYALATASNGAIKPGDLLTTSTILGHAMKATDRKRSHGAIIGKAMECLEEGEGLVLVLVTLQ